MGRETGRMRASQSQHEPDVRPQAWMCWALGLREPVYWLQSGDFAVETKTSRISSWKW